MQSFSLNGTWEGACFSPNGPFDFTATVPGSSIADLIANGKLPRDIFYGENARCVQAYETCDFVYHKTFDCTVSEGVTYTLTFERLDTYAAVTLNGTPLGNTRNGNIPHSFPVTGVLKTGENRLSVRFTSPITAVEGMPVYGGAFTTERLNTRRMQCTYGWDWVARFVCCGISGNVTVTGHTPGEMRTEGVYVYTKSIGDEAAGIGVDVTFAPESAAGQLTLTVLSPDGTVCRRLRRHCNEPLVRLTLDIPAPQLWYPLGYGAQPLYTLLLEDGSGRELNRELFGIRTVKILQLPDAPGSENEKKCREIRNGTYDRNEQTSGFILQVNGQKVLCMGANWVPVEPFYHGDTAEKITRTLELSAAAGVNMIRVWGGGAFETPHFYTECSRLGIMVTQDFLMACGQYPESQDWFIEELQKEADYAARLIRNQPCLMWWSGDNENAVEGTDTDETYMGRQSAFAGIAPVLYRLDPYRDFLPSSPYGGNQYASNTVGTTHNTQFLGCDILPYMLGGDCSDYRTAWKRFRARFIAEEPQLGAVSEGTVRRFATEEEIFGESDAMWNYHTQTNPGLSNTIFEITAQFGAAVLGAFTSPRDRFFKLRYLQYEWIRLSLEQLRREQWFCSGVIFWMLNDCWPAASGWAIIDYYNKPKDAYYAFRRLAQDRVLSFDCEEGVCRLYASNLREAVDATVRVVAVKGDKTRELWQGAVSLPAAASAVAATLSEPLVSGETLVAELIASGKRDRTFYRPGALELVPTEVGCTVDEAACTVTVTAAHYVHAVELEGDAVFADNCFSLLPGESRTVTYTPLSPTAVTHTAYTVK